MGLLFSLRRISARDGLCGRGSAECWRGLQLKTECVFLEGEWSGTGGQSDKAGKPVAAGARNGGRSLHQRSAKYGRNLFSPVPRNELATLPMIGDKSGDGAPPRPPCPNNRNISNLPPIKDEIYLQLGTLSIWTSFGGCRSRSKLTKPSVLACKFTPHLSA